MPSGRCLHLRSTHPPEHRTGPTRPNEQHFGPAGSRSECLALTFQGLQVLHRWVKQSQNRHFKYCKRTDLLATCWNHQKDPTIAFKLNTPEHAFTNLQLVQDDCAKLPAGSTDLSPNTAQQTALNTKRSFTSHSPNESWTHLLHSVVDIFCIS